MVNFGRRQNRGVRDTIQALSHAFALAAIANNVCNSVYLDLRTISGWRCGVLFLPLAWSLSSVLVQVWGMLVVRVRLPGTEDGSRSSISNLMKSTNYTHATTGKDTVTSELLLAVASLFAIIQVIFGVFHLSSLVFISAMEALQVFVLYAVSTLVCQWSWSWNWQI